MHCECTHRILQRNKSMCGCMLACVPVQGAKAAKMAEFEKRQAEAAEKQREKEKLMEAELERQEKERQVREAKRISAMQEAIRTGIPYQTPLDPPSGPPTTPLPAWNPGEPRPEGWQGHIHPPRGVEGS